MTTPTPTARSASARSLSPRTPWPASGVLLRVGLSLALLAVTVPFLHSQLPLLDGHFVGIGAWNAPARTGGPVRDTYRSAAPVTAPLKVAVTLDLNDLTLRPGPIASPATDADAPALTATLSGGHPGDRLRVTPEGDRTRLKVVTAHTPLHLNPGTLDLRVHPGTPLDLDLTGSGRTVLDLSRSPLLALRVRQDLGSARVTFPARGTYSADLRTDAGTSDLTFPPGTYTARATVHTDVGSVTVHVPRGANVHLNAGSDPRDLRLPTGFTPGGRTGTGPDLTLDLSTDAGPITVQEDAR
ncbi:hypothetical protein [Deinococcus aquiradiocola]|uniref:Adhesin domain-containing protein n=1 Tax=Deinococcus aquiradiocola TaxID=393059 RepID=A0A917UUU6_9DEIO|nr:hypothetical protein [Deinococcus aquiradiocola]GGJ86781.1 hypothetical protein GCM10008939_33440 [Deinococcus aquiradiocola]